MAVIQVDTNASEDLVYVTGSIEKITSNRRAMRLLKDNAVFTIKDDCLEFEVGADLTKCINRIKTAAKYTQCDVEIKGNANSGIQAYYEEEQNFANFSKKALDIRNNDCDIEEFKKFKDSLIDNMQNRTLYELQMLAAYHLAFSQNAFLYLEQEKRALYMELMHTFIIYQKVTQRRLIGFLLFHR
jgi:hypothetical protein